MFVTTAEGQEQVLKPQQIRRSSPSGPWVPKLPLGSTSRATQNPRIVGLGATRTAVWSLQERLAGHVTHRLMATQTARLLALDRRDNTDSGRRRPWRDNALRAARGWLAETPIDPACAATLVAALDRGERADLLDYRVVHGDFHHGNALFEDDDTVAVFYWDIAGPGDWRFDLVMLAFGCLVRPRSCEPAAAALIIDAVRSECHPTWPR